MVLKWAIPLNRDTHDMILFNPRDRQRGIFCGPGTDIFGFTTLVQTPQSNQSRPWDRHLLLYYPGTDGSVQKEDPGTDIYCFTTLGQTFYCFTTLGQMAQSKNKTPGQTFTALLPWDRWLSPKKKTLGQTFTALLPWDRWLSPTKADSGDGRHFTAVA